MLMVLYAYSASRRNEIGIVIIRIGHVVSRGRTSKRLGRRAGPLALGCLPWLRLHAITLPNVKDMRSGMIMIVLEPLSIVATLCSF